MESGPTLHRLESLSPRAFQHPADRAASAALGQVPGLETAVRKLTELRYERALRQSLLANSIQIGPRQLPEIWEVYERALRTLDMPETYDLYVSQWPLANAAAIGTGKPVIVLSSQLATLLGPDELWSTLGHELGHILCGHVTNQTALILLTQLSQSAPIVPGLPLRAVRAALLEWSRAAELSADRAGALACRDPLASCRALMVLAAGLPADRLDLDAFLAQAAAYEDWDSAWDRTLRLLAQRQQTHPYSVRRVAALMEWVRSGEYDRILGGQYRRRGADDLRGDAGAAYEHYVNRFWAIVQEAGRGTDEFREKIGDWLQRRPPDED
ncbi:MAG TPA: M48 family metallopeptidase [Gaiellaceae bacterium]|nr:M48 family metallopeptidase [Gaiellaceae bacterium]